MSLAFAHNPSLVSHLGNTALSLSFNKLTLRISLLITLHTHTQFEQQYLQLYTHELKILNCCCTRTTERTQVICTGSTLSRGDFRFGVFCGWRRRYSLSSAVPVTVTSLIVGIWKVFLTANVTCSLNLESSQLTFSLFGRKWRQGRDFIFSLAASI